MVETLPSLAVRKMHVLVAVVLMVMGIQAQAVPSYARQTG